LTCRKGAVKIVSFQVTFKTALGNQYVAKDPKKVIKDIFTESDSDLRDIKDNVLGDTLNKYIDILKRKINLPEGSQKAFQVLFDIAPELIFSAGGIISSAEMKSEFKCCSCKGEWSEKQVESNTEEANFQGLGVVVKGNPDFANEFSQQYIFKNIYFAQKILANCKKINEENENE